MGFYIEPLETKEEWLSAHAVCKLQDPPMPEHLDLASGNTFVCLVDNDYYLAAAIVTQKSDITRFSIEDGRDKEWYVVPIEDICVLHSYMRDVFYLAERKNCDGCKYTDGNCDSDCPIVQQARQH